MFPSPSHRKILCREDQSRQESRREATITTTTTVGRHRRVLLLAARTVLQLCLLRIPSVAHSFLPPSRAPFYRGLAMTPTGTAEVNSTSDGGMTMGNNPRRGAFIVLEGVDRCGKTTQVQRLVETLQKQSIPAEAIRFPNRTTTIGQMINAYLCNATDLDDHAIHLLFSANRWESLAFIQERLAAGTTLVCDRYAFSGVAFSASKPNLDYEWCKECDRGLPSPDAVIFLDIPTDKASKRGQYGEERYEKEEIQQRVRGNFDRLMKGDHTWHRVDATGTIEEVGDAISAIARKQIKEVGEKPLGRLWGSDGSSQLCS